MAGFGPALLENDRQDSQTWWSRVDVLLSSVRNHSTYGDDNILTLFYSEDNERLTRT